MPAQVTVIDDNGQGLKLVPMAAEFGLFGNLEFGLRQWLWALTTADATPIALAWDARNEALENNSVYAFEGFVLARYAAANTVGVYRLQGAIKRGAAAANTALVGTTGITAFEDTAGMDLGVTADTTNGRPILTATGVAATSILWTAQVRWVRL